MPKKQVHKHTTCWDLRDRRMLLLRIEGEFKTIQKFRKRKKQRKKLQKKGKTYIYLILSHLAKYFPNSIILRVCTMQINVSCQWKTIFDFYFVNTDIINNTILLSRIKTTPRMYHCYSANCLPPPMENRSTLFSGFPLENKPQKENVYNLPGPIKDHLLIDTSAVQCRAPY